MTKKPSKIKQALRKLVIKALFPVAQRGGWMPLITESFTGAFQTNDFLALDTYLRHPTVYACVSQIAYDIGKLRTMVTKKDEDGIAVETKHKDLSPLIKRPNSFQIWQKFVELWLVSLLTYGNTYVLKIRNRSGIITSLIVLDPSKIEPLVAENGDVFYRIEKDCLSKVPKDFDAIPAYEIIHDTMITLFHPLIGVPPMYAATLATRQGLAIQEHSANFFENNAQPSGLLTAPGQISDETAERLKTRWQERHSGDNAGKIAVLGDGLKYEPMGQSAADSDMIKQLNWSDEKICSVYKVPPYKVHVGQSPTHQESETLDRKYYSDCLQRLIESIENLLNEGLSVPENYGIVFNLEDLMRMDMSLKMKIITEGVKGGVYAPNEGRKKLNLSPVKGGDTPYMQQQNYSLAALDERDKTNPLAATQPIEDETDEEDTQKWLIELRMKENISGIDK